MTASADAIRTFVAVLLPDAVRAALAAEVEALRRLTRGVGWVAADNLHVTLKFVGEIDPAAVTAVGAGLAGIAAHTPSFELAVEGLGAFPTPTRPRVVWAGLGPGAAQVAEIAGRVESALAELGIASDERAFAAHVTLGRVREPRPDPALARAIAAAGGRGFGGFRVEAIALMRSQLHSKGVRYSMVGTWSLQTFSGETAGPP